MKDDKYFGHPRPEVLKHIPNNIKTILDVGCATGEFSFSVKQKLHAETWGIEINKDIAERAKIKLDNVLVGTIQENLNLLPHGYFDCIVFNDVLEHMIEPEQSLVDSIKLLSTDGIIITSIPNVRYYSNLKNLLFHKDWNYQDEGILDKTHLRFYTKKSMIRMFDNCGYAIIKTEGINPLKSLKFLILNLILFNQISDSKYLQFINIIKPKSTSNIKSFKT